MSDKNPGTKKAAVKKTASAKKTSVKKTSTVKKKAVAKTAAKASQLDSNVMPIIQSMIQEMSRDRESRDKQISSLIKEVREGFSTLSDKSSKQGEEHEKEMTGLYQSLKNAFGTIKDSSIQQEQHNLDIFKRLSDSIMMDHKQSLKEVHEQEKLQDKKLQNLAMVQKKRTGQNRLIAIPGVIIAIIGVIYMFHVVNVMETAMTSMSQDTHSIQLSVGNMSERINTISQDTNAMSTNLQQLNGNMYQMSKDMNVLTHNVAPAMQGMRDVMPWAP